MGLRGVGGDHGDNDKRDQVTRNRMPALKREPSSRDPATHGIDETVLRTWQLLHDRVYGIGIALPCAASESV